LPTDDYVTQYNKNTSDIDDYQNSGRFVKSDGGNLRIDDAKGTIYTKFGGSELSSNSSEDKEVDMIDEEEK
jgi:hypothetical protein